MDYKKTLDKIKGLFSTEKNAFKDIAGENGMVYRLSEDGVAVGAEIKIIMNEGALTLIPSGVIPIEGVDCVVNNGFIEEVRTEQTVINPETGETAPKVEDLAQVEDKEEAAPEQAPEQEQKPAEPAEPTAPNVNEKITAIEDRLSKLEEMISNLVQKLEQNMSAVEDKQKQLEKEVEEFGKTPMTEPISKTNRFKFQKEQPKNEWVEKIRKQINKQ